MVRIGPNQRLALEVLYTVRCEHEYNAESTKLDYVSTSFIAHEIHRINTGAQSFVISPLQLRRTTSNSLERLLLNNFVEKRVYAYGRVRYMRWQITQAGVDALLNLKEREKVRQ